MSIKLILITTISIINVFYSASQPLYIINIENEIERKDQNFSLKLSEYIDTIIYLPLKTDTDYLIDREPKFSATRDEIAVRTASECFIFNKSTGEFIRKIGNKGRGPGEFRSTRGFVNPYKQSIYLEGIGNKLLKYNYDGDFIKEIIIPEFQNDISSPSLPTNYTWFNENIICYFSNMTGLEKKLLVIFDENGKKLSVFENINSYSDKRGFSMNLNESQFYHFNSNLFYKEDYSDTIFQVTRNCLVPKLILHTGKHRAPYSSKWMNSSETNKHEFIEPHNLIELDNYFLFEFYYHKKNIQCLYSKKSNTLRIAERDIGIINDIDGFVKFSPVSLASDGSLIGFVEAYRVLEWFTENPDKATELPLHLQKLKKIKETDNPIVMIAKLKE